MSYFLEFVETTCNAGYVELFKLFLFKLFIKNSCKFINFASKPDLQWGLNNFEHNCTSFHTLLKQRKIGLLLSNAQKEAQKQENASAKDALKKLCIFTTETFAHRRQCTG